MKNNYTIQNMLLEWGQGSRQNPAENAELKNKILANFSVVPAKTSRAHSAFRIPWLSLAFAGIAALTLFVRTNNFILTSEQTQSIPGSVSRSFSVEEKSFAPANQMADIYLYNPLPPLELEIPTSDNREFLKTSYSAQVKSRDIIELSEQITTAVRGFAGRVDLSSSSKKFGHINFVIPADKFESFRTQIISLAGERFFNEQVQTENLLPQKRNIEETQKNITQNLTEVEKQKTNFIESHKKTAASLQAQINLTSKQLTDLQNTQPTSLEHELQIEAQKKELTNKIKALKIQATNENNNYFNQLNYFDSQIQAYQTSLEYTNKQNTQLLDNVATVSGSITLNWISLWEFINLYLPAYWISALLIIAAIAAYFFRRSKLILP